MHDKLPQRLTSNRDKKHIFCSSLQLSWKSSETSQVYKIWRIIKYFPKNFLKIFPRVKNLAGIQVFDW